MSAQKLADEFIWDVYGSADGLPSDDVRSIVLDKDCIWVGTASGVAKFDPKSDSVVNDIILPSVEITSLSVDESYLWIGTADSWVKQYDKANNSLIQDSVVENKTNMSKVICLQVDNDSVWVGTEFGIYQYNKNKRDWKHYTTFDGLPDNKVMSIASTPKGLWCGTFKNGVSIFDYSTLRWHRPDKQISLIGRSVPVITYSEGDMWFLWYEDFMNGVSSYDPNTLAWEELPITQWESDTKSIQLTDTRHINTSTIAMGANEKEVWIGTDSVIISHRSSQWTQPINYPSKFSGTAPSCIAVDNDFVWLATFKGHKRLKKNMIRGY